MPCYKTSLSRPVVHNSTGFNLYILASYLLMGGVRIDPGIKRPGQIR